MSQQREAAMAVQNRCTGDSVMKKLIAVIASALLATTAFEHTAVAVDATDAQKGQMKANSEKMEAQATANKKKAEAQSDAAKAQA